MGGRQQVRTSLSCAFSARNLEWSSGRPVQTFLNHSTPCGFAAPLLEEVATCPSSVSTTLSSSSPMFPPAYWIVLSSCPTVSSNYIQNLFHRCPSWCFFWFLHFSSWSHDDPHHLGDHLWLLSASTRQALVSQRTASLATSSFMSLVPRSSTVSGSRWLIFVEWMNESMKCLFLSMPVVTSLVLILITSELDCYSHSSTGCPASGLPWR